MNQPKPNSRLLALLLAGLSFLTLGTPVASAAVDTCPVEDQTGGWGGQSLECAFTCPGPGGTAYLSVSADDNDATVSGSGSCADVELHCGEGGPNCADEGIYTGAGAGTCSADSDETYDSGLYLSCTASAKEGPVGPGGVPRCILTDPIRVCTGIGVCGMQTTTTSGETRFHYRAAALTDPSRVCTGIGVCGMQTPTTSGETRFHYRAAAPTASKCAAYARLIQYMSGADTADSGAHLYSGHGEAVAFSCLGVNCYEVIPVCGLRTDEDTLETYKTCSI